MSIHSNEPHKPQILGKSYSIYCKVCRSVNCDSVPEAVIYEEEIKSQFPNVVENIIKKKYLKKH